MVDKELVDKELVDKDTVDTDTVDTDTVDTDTVDTDTVDTDTVDTDTVDTDTVDTDTVDTDTVDTDTVDTDTVDEPDKEPGVREEFRRFGRRWSDSYVALVGLAVRLDRSGEWALDGAVTCAHWIADALGIEVCTAREWIRVGRHLDALPLIRERFENGKLSFTQVRALTRHANAENEAELIALAAGVRAGRLRTVLAAWAARFEDDATRDRRQHEERALRWSVEPDGMVRVNAFLAPQQFAFFAAAIEAQVTSSARDPLTQSGIDATGSRGSRSPRPRRLTLAQQRADALIRLVSTAAGSGSGSGSGEDSGAGALNAEVIIHVRGDGATLDDGTPITMSAVERIVPTAALRAMIHDAQRRPVNVSGLHRRHTVRQKRLVKERDRVCVECGSTELLEFHHQPPYEQSGQTLVEETELRCHRCHQRKHGKAA